MTAAALPWREPERAAALLAALDERIVVLDGAMGTMIQALEFGEEAFRGERLADHPADLQGDNDVLVLSQPAAIADIHRAFLAAGADIVTTNTFNATTISQADYQAESLVTDINREAARIARASVDELDRPAWVAGALGPTNRTASMSPDVERPEYRNVDFDELRAAYGEAARALVEGGADLLMVETVFDTLNCKAALFAIDELFEELGARLPLWISGTITDASGRTLSGQTASAFWYSVRHARPLLVGLNCALGAVELRPWIQELARVADTRVSAHPNAGLPNELGEYDDTPEHMAEVLGEFAGQGLVNVVGGCCGTTPGHIAAIATAVRGLAPRPAP